MSRRRNSIDLDGSFDLDMAPMLALMVTLIPMLLLSTVFVQVVTIDTALPQVVKEAVENDRKKKERLVLVNLEMKVDSGFNLFVTVDGQVKERYRLPKVAQEWAIDELHQRLIDVKRKHPLLFRLELKPGNKVVYDEIVKVIDASRNISKTEKKFFVEDKKTGQKVETDLMFPDVVFANVVEG